jgi:8-oxo-dGTP pyrophosphatase MutT (NUDIX family)
MRSSTLLFLLKSDGTAITDICLAMKKRGFGAGRYNGVGGKVEEGESIEDAVKRETFEEIGVKVTDIEKRAELSFTFPYNPKFDQLVHVYFALTWDGEPSESEEMNPEWYKVADIPYAQMWPDDIFWLPKVLEGSEVRGRFVFGEGDVVAEQEVNVI